MFGMNIVMEATAKPLIVHDEEQFQGVLSGGRVNVVS